MNYREVENELKEKYNLDLSAPNWAAVFHTAFRHAGNSRDSTIVWEYINRMEEREWLQISEYFLMGIRENVLDTLNHVSELTLEWKSAALWLGDILVGEVISNRPHSNKFNAYVTTLLEGEYCGQFDTIEEAMQQVEIKAKEALSKR